MACYDAGVTGAPGPRGPVGPRGPQGVPGTSIVGPAGQKGLKGNQGVTGLQGIGCRGMTGVSGNTGIANFLDTTAFPSIIGITPVLLFNETDNALYVGVTGADHWIQISAGAQQGATGATGYGVTGPQGFTGAQGLQGDQGTTGLIGETGAQGITGIQGDTGAQGLTGLIGPGGLTGVQGITGSQGVQGYTGLQGLTGADGIQGIQGNTGAIGPTGVIGLTGSFGITGYQGITGPIGLGMTGPQGETGTQGVPGIQGLQGTQGNQGVTGLVGSTGLQGSTGTAGTLGVTGPQGQTGLQGFTGAQGQGVTGLQGATGTAGTLGVTGPQGQTGIQGTTGSAGTLGVTGPQGITGLTGQTGVQGQTGTKGNTGVQGQTGLQGPTGIIGSSGIQGITGLRGITGIGTTLATDILRYGFLNRTETKIFFDGTSSFVLKDAGSGWSYYRTGIKYSITGDKTVAIPTTDGSQNFVYIDSVDGSLTTSTVGWTLNDTKVPTATVYWDSTQTPKYIMCDERHQCLIDRAWHRENHFTTGTELASAGTLSGLTPGSDSTDAKTFGYQGAQIFDEDLTFYPSALTDPTGGAQVYYNMYRTSPTRYVWQISDMPFKYTDLGGGTYGFIEYDNGSGVSTQAGANAFVNTYVIVTNAVDSAEANPEINNSGFRYTVLQGRGTFTTAALAAGESIASFNLIGFPFFEVVAVYQITWATTNRPNTVKGRCRYLSTQNIKANVVSTAVSSGTNHNLLAGLQGGVVNEYYHLTSAEYLALQATGITGFGATGLQGFTGVQGNTGVQGATGVQGQTGVQGNTGVQGVTGLVGQTGAQGTTGLVGQTGSQGVTGLVGQTGSQGNTGLQGTQGNTGVQGIQGNQGNTGIQGVTGLIGQTGSQGNTGVQGTQGNQGNTGIQGVTGLVGQTGAQGNTGLQGVTGLIGQTGIQGTTGLIGQTGTKGNTGVQGTTGLANFLDAAGAYPALTKVTLYWSETDDALFAGITGADKWVQISAGSLKGATGAAGQGVTGLQGITGSQGVTGAGIQGQTGLQGPGGTGATGAQGFTGTKGNTGIQGVTGTGAGSSMPVVPVLRVINNYTLTSTDFFVWYDGTGGHTLTLPAATNKYMYIIKDHASVNVLVKPTGTDTIESGAAGASITMVPTQSLTFLADATNNWNLN